MAETIRILYPDDRNISEGEILNWAKDAFDNGELNLDFSPTSLKEAILALEDAGLVTFHESVNRLLK